MLQGNSKIPQIDTDAAPKEESGDLFLLNRALTGIQDQVKNFHSALHLFEYCALQMSVLPGQRSEAFSSWMFVASRDAVMSVWHFRQQITAANNFANTSAYVAPRLNRLLLGMAHAKFDEYFPEFARIRHAVAHAGELAKNKATFEEHAFSGVYERGSIRAPNVTQLTSQNTLQDRTYTCTFEGKIVHCEISGVTFARLNEVASLFYRGFTEQPATESKPADEG